MDIQILCCALSLLLFTTIAPCGEIKRWVDEDGGTHFGDNPPHGTAATLSTPVVITTKPSSNNTLSDILRPGERRMLKQYEQRGRRLERGKREGLRKSRKKEKQLTKMDEKCHYHRQKKYGLERKLRNGYKPARKRSIQQSIDRHRSLIRHYCS